MSSPAASPDTTLREDEGVLGPRHRGLTIGIFSLIFMVAFEAMAVATAMPIVVKDLQGMSFYAWGFSGFLIASMVATVVSGRLSDRVGPLRPLLIGVTSFLAGLAVAGTAASMLVFVLGRMLQGLGAGFIVVAIYVTIARSYDEKLRPRAFSMTATAWVLPAIIGPVAAGLLAEQVSWRLVFLGILPLAVLPLVVIVPRVPRLSEEPSTEPASARIIWSALAAAIGIALLQYAGQNLRWPSLVLAVGGLALIVPALPRLLPVGTFRLARGLPMLVVMRGIIAGGFAGIEAFLPLMLITYREMSAPLAGLVLTTSTISWATGSWLQSRPNLRLPRFVLVRVGAACVGAGSLLVLVTLWHAAPAWTAAVGWFVAGLGMGLAFSSISVLLFELSPKSEQGFNSAALQVADSAGCIVMVGLGGVFFAALRETAGLAWAFAPIYLVMALLLGVAVVVAGRVRPAR